MRKTIKNILLTLFICTVSLSAAQAQNCNADFEAIVKLKKPKPGSFTVWDGVLGEREFRDEFLSVAALENNNVIVAGTKTANDQKSVGPTLLGKKLILGEIDLRGRMIWDKMHDINGLDTITDMITHDKGTIVLASRKTAKQNNKEMIVLFFGSGGSLYKTKTMKERGYDIQPASIIPTHDGKSFLIVASALNRKTQSRHSLFYRISPKGSVFNKRSFKTGLDNQLLNIIAIKDGTYLATGHIQGENGLATGWALRMTQDGEIIWQRSYPRGSGARLMTATDYGDQRLVVGGQVLPTDKSGSGGWLMMLDQNNGDTLWQRYYHGKNSHYTIDDILLSDKSDFLSAMVNIFPTAISQNGLKDHVVRILSIGSQGKIYDLQDYANGEGGQANKMILNKRHDRVIVGTTQVAYQIQQEEGAEPNQTPRFERSNEGWIVAAPKPEIYRDPCRRALSKSKTKAADKSLFETIFP